MKDFDTILMENVEAMEAFREHIPRIYPFREAVQTAYDKLPDGAQLKYRYEDILECLNNIDMIIHTLTWQGRVDQFIEDTEKENV